MSATEKNYNSNTIAKEFTLILIDNCTKNRTVGLILCADVGI